MNQETIKLFKELTELPGAPGFEAPVREYMRKQLEPYADEIIQDRLGSIFAVKKSKKENAPKVMMAGHMDEIGFMVTQIKDNGMVKFVPLGGWWNQNMLAHRVEIHTSNGPIPAVISSVSPHLLTPEQRKKPMELKNMLIDCGASSKEEAYEMGVQEGQMITPMADFIEMADGKKLLGKAFDNRYGCVLAIEVLKELSDVELDCDLYIGATVQEEVGLRGAKTASFMIDPDIFFGADASPARDETGDKNAVGKLGHGPLLRIFDRSMVTHKGIREYVLKNIEENELKYQYYTSPGGTDAGAVHLNNEGVPSIIVGIPARYIHSHSGVIHKDDYESAKVLMKKLITNLNAESYKEILENS